MHIKQLFIFVAYFIFTLSVFSQSEKGIGQQKHFFFNRDKLDNIRSSHKIFQMLEKSTNGDSVDYSYIYDDKGRLKIEIYYQSFFQYYPCKIVFEYDSIDNQILQVKYWFDKSKNVYIEDEKNENNYDIKGNMISRIESRWDNGDNQWVVFLKYKYCYDIHGNMISKVEVSWNEYINQWSEYKWKYNYGYDPNGNIISQDFGENWKYKYFYNDNGKITLLKKNIKTYDGRWVDDYKTEYSYDHKGNMILKVYFNCAVNAHSLAPDSKNEYTYDYNDNLILEVYSFWHSASNPMGLGTRNEYSYNDNLNVTIDIKYYWDETSHQWDPSRQHTFTYDSKGNRTSQSEYRWEGGKWINLEKTEYTFDTTYYKNEILLPFGSNMDYMEMGWTSYYWNYNKWEPTHKESNYFSKFEVNNVQEEQIPVFNILFDSDTELLTIKWAGEPNKLRIQFSDRFKIIYGSNIKNKAIISLISFPNGVYTLFLLDTKKLIYTENISLDRKDL